MTQTMDPFRVLTAHVLDVIESHARLTGTPVPEAPYALAASIARSLAPEHVWTTSTPGLRTSELQTLRVVAEVAR